MSSRIESALLWSGSKVTLSLFTIATSKPELALSADGIRPIEVRSYELEDADHVLENRKVFEFDVKFDKIPEGLDTYLHNCLGEAINQGSELAWFGFEGSFDFEYLLAPEVASQIYAVADTSGIAVATEDEVLMSEAWKERVAAARGSVLKPLEPAT